MQTVRAPDPPPRPGGGKGNGPSTATCGTGRPQLHRDMDARVGPSAVLGHEMSGTVAACGPGVIGWGVDDPVPVLPIRSCDACRTCQSGAGHICPNLKFLGIDS